MKKLSEQVQVAKALKKDLKERFINAKIIVRSQSFAGGNSVDAVVMITEKEDIKKGTSDLKIKYQAGDFDGMTDCYNYNEKNTSEPTAKYVFIRKEYSKEIIKELVEKHNSHWDYKISIDEYDRLDWETEEGKRFFSNASPMFILLKKEAE